MIASFSVRDLHRLSTFQDSALHLLSPVSVRAGNPLFLKDEGGMWLVIRSKLENIQW